MRIVVKPLAVVRHHVCAQCTRIVAKHTFLAVFFQTEIDDSLCFIVLKPSQFSHFAFLVNDLYFLNHLGGDILRGCLYVIAKEFLSVNTYTFDFFAIDGHVAFFVHLYAVHLLKQFLYGGGFADLVCSSVVFYRIAFDGHFCGASLYAHFGKVLHLLLQTDGRHVKIVVRHLYGFGDFCKTHR